MFDGYIRISRTGDRSDNEATETYKEQLYTWAAGRNIMLDEIAVDADVSGSVKVSERELERLIQKVERGDSEGILTPYLDRLGRDVIEGALAYKRIAEAGGRLVCTQDGIDSVRPGDQMVFNLRMAIAQDYLSRVRANYQAAVDKKVEQRAHIYKTPFGYRKGDDGRLVVDEADAGIVRELFERRAAGEDAGKLMRWLRDVGVVSSYTGRPFTKSGVRSLWANRSYLGEIRVQNGKKGQPKVIKDYHPPLVTPDLFAAANAVKGAYHERTGKLTGQAALRGLVYCGTCGRRLRINGSTSSGERVANYTCTYADCAKRAGVRASRLDAWVQYAVQQAAVDKNPYVAAVIEGNTAFQDALAAVAEAERMHDELRDDLDAQRQLGTKNWLAALKVRQEALELARVKLAEVRPTTTPKKAKSLFEFEAGELQRFIARIDLQPSANGRWSQVGERVDVYFVGATDPWQPPQGDPELLAALTRGLKHPRQRGEHRIAVAPDS